MQQNDRSLADGELCQPSLAGILSTSLWSRLSLAVGETVSLLHPPPPLVGLSIGMDRERQQNDSLANG